MPEPQAAPNPPDTPERLLARYLAGDGDAFGALVGRYEERLFAFIARMIGDSHLAEDVFQQVWIKVAGSAASFDGRASFSTWLFAVARNATLDEIRRRRNRPFPSDPAEVAGGLAGRPDRKAIQPLEKMARDELGGRVAAAVASLPEAQREVFLMKEEGGLDFAEIGLALDCGRETAKSRFRLAVEKLRQALAPEGDGL